jgi:hypothetical protein
MAAGSGAAAAALLAGNRAPTATSDRKLADDSDLAAADGVIEDLRIWREERAKAVAEQTKAMEAKLEADSSRIPAEPYLPELPKHATPADPARLAAIRNTFEEIKSSEGLAGVSSSDSRLREARAHAGNSAASEADSPMAAAAAIRSDVIALHARELAAERLAALGIDPSTLGDASDDEAEPERDGGPTASASSASGSAPRHPS